MAAGTSPTLTYADLDDDARALIDRFAFHTRPLTVGDSLLLQRLTAGQHDVATLVELVRVRTDPPATEAEVLALPLDLLGALIERLLASLQDAQTLMRLNQRLRAGQHDTPAPEPSRRERRRGRWW